MKNIRTRPQIKTSNNRLQCYVNIDLSRSCSNTWFIYASLSLQPTDWQLIPATEELVTVHRSACHVCHAKHMEETMFLQTKCKHFVQIFGYLNHREKQCAAISLWCRTQQGSMDWATCDGHDNTQSHAWECAFPIWERTQQNIKHIWYLCCGILSSRL